MSVNNEAFLMKLGWGILSEPDSLWVAVLRSKYVKSDAVIPDLKAKGILKPLWKGIFGVWQKVLKGIKWVVGNGEIVRFWLNNWVDNEGPLVHKALGVIPEAMLNKTVAEFVDDVG